MTKHCTSYPTNNNPTTPFWVIIPAAGKGQRMQSDIPKQYLQLGSKTILEHTINCFINHPHLLGIIICLAKNDTYWSTLKINSPLIHTTIGGKERADSVLSGLNFLNTLHANPEDWVLVHDAARPNLTQTDLNTLLSTLHHDPIGGLLAIPSRDTLKQADQQNKVTQTVDRSTFWQALTPQMFRKGLLEQALHHVQNTHQKITDESSAIEHLGHQPQLIQGRSDNLKITYPEDINLLSPYLI